MAETVSKREQLRGERRRQIIEAALAVFAEKGFNAAKVSDVAARAGVSQGTIYLYFEGKEQLLVQALGAFFDDFGQGTISALEEWPTSAGKLRALGRVLAEFAVEAGGLFTLFLEFWASSSHREEAGQLWTSMLAKYKDLVVELVKEGVSNGEFKPVDAESLVWAMMATYDGLAAYVMLMPDLDLVRVSQAFVDTLLEGLQAGTQGDVVGC
jgi:AcrR family transcriptional regulator